MSSASGAYLISTELIASGVSQLDSTVAPSLPLQQFHVLHDTVQLDVEAPGQRRQHGHVAIREEGVAASKLRKVIIMVPVERGDLKYQNRQSVVRAMEGDLWGNVDALPIPHAAPSPLSHAAPSPPQWGVAYQVSLPPEWLTKSREAPQANSRLLR